MRYGKKIGLGLRLYAFEKSSTEYSKTGFKVARDPDLPEIFAFFILRAGLGKTLLDFLDMKSQQLRCLISHVARMFGYTSYHIDL